MIALGVFGAPQGVRGEVRVKAYTGDPKAIGVYGPLTDAKGAAVFALKVVRALRDDMVVARVEGVDTRQAAAALTGVELFARRAQLPPPDTDEFYYDDLVGLEAVTAEGAALGRVVGVANHGAGDILEIALTAGGETLLLPFTRQVVPEIDFAGDRILVVQPAEIEGESPPKAQRDLRA
jgi:16S rRNA processing protein RimM